MNKKILAVLMALMMVLTSAVAFAEGITITKDYTTTQAGVIPTETLTFTATNTKYTDINGNTGDTLTGTLTGTVTTNRSTAQYNVVLNTLPTFTAAGVYEYTVKETAGKIQGVTYDATELKFNVYVIHEVDEDGNQTGNLAIKQIVPQTKNTDGNKVGGFTNAYDPQNTTDENALTITKTVTGNAGDQTAEFPVKLTFKAKDGFVFDTSFAPKANGEALTLNKASDSEYTAEITVKHGSEIKITNVPANATVKVEETNAKGHTVKYNDAATAPTVTAGTAQTVAIENFRDTEIDTGITTDSMPYIMLMAFVMILAAAVVLKKRSVNE